MAPTSAIIGERQRQPGGCAIAPVHPDLSAGQAQQLARIVKALADPTRLRIVDAVRKAAPQAICQCELLPLFAISQAALSKHLKTLVMAGLLGSEHRGLWTYYFPADPPALDRLRAWFDWQAPLESRAA